MHKRLNKKELLIHLVVALLAVEGVARLSTWMVGTSIHQPLVVSHRIAPDGVTTAGERLQWIANDKGARGELYHGQRERYAIFGTSTTAGSFLDQEQTWPEQLAKELGPKNVHVDNFAIDGGTGSEAIRTMKKLAGKGLVYDVAFLQFNMVRKAAPKEYSSRWEAKGMLQSVAQFPAMITAQIRREPRLKAILKAIQERMAPPSRGIVDLGNRDIRNAGNVKFVYEAPDFDKSQLEANLNELIQSAKSIAKRVIVVSQPVAYSDDALPGVTQRWITLRPARDQQGAFLDNQSLVDGIAAIQSEIRKVAEHEQIEFIDLSSPIAPLFSQTTELFDDKWHPAPAGARLIGTTIAKYIQSTPPDKKPVPADLPLQLQSQLP